MLEHDPGDPVEILIQEPDYHRRLGALDEGGEVRQIGEQERHEAALAPGLQRIHLDLMRDARREVPRHRRARLLRLGLEALQRTQPLDAQQGLLDRALEIVEIDWLDQEVERAAIHRGADIRHVPVGRHDHRAHVLVEIAEAGEESQPVHARHVDIGEHHVDVRSGLEELERMLAVAREDEDQLAAPDPAPKALGHEGLEVRLVIDHEDPADRVRRPL